MKVQAIQQQVDEWNRSHPVGTMVVVTIRGDGTTDEAKTMSAAWMEEGKAWVDMEGHGPCMMTPLALRGPGRGLVLVHGHPQDLKEVDDAV